MTSRFTSDRNDGMQSAAGPAPGLFHGTGPGARTADGCSVELYRQSVYSGQIDHLQPLLPPGSTVLELGCGTGLLTRRLIEFGCVVTAVDHSLEMLEHVPDQAHKVHSDITELNLPARYDVVLLASGLINHVDVHTRSGFLAAAKRHLQPSGKLIFEVQSAPWLRSAEPGVISHSDQLTIELVEVNRNGATDPSQVAMTLKYTMGAAIWTHTFVIAALDEHDIQNLLRDNGFGRARILDPAGRWYVA